MSDNVTRAVTRNRALHLERTDFEAVEDTQMHCAVIKPDKQHINSIASYIGQITTDINNESQLLQTRMRTSIDQLKGADDDNRTGLNKSQNAINSGTGAQH